MPKNDRFDRAQTTPLYWYNCANDLRGSAAALRAAADPDFSATVANKFGLGSNFRIGIAGENVYEMLWGMSLELLFKAVAVAQGKEVLHHHKLVELAIHVDFPVSIDDENLLRVLTEAILWSGRYPIPKRKNEWENTLDIGDKALRETVPAGNLILKRYNRAMDWPNVNALWKRVSELYWQHHYDT